MRQAELSDVPRLQAMFTQFVATTQYRKYVGNDPAYASQQIARLVEMDDGAVFVSECDGSVVGMLGLLVFAHPWSGARVGTEAFWWLDPLHRGYGVYLLRRGLRWLKERGAESLTMMAPVDKPRVAEIYERLGFERVEVIYQKAMR